MKADLEVTAEDVGKDFVADPKAADMKYKDKLVQVTGKVEKTEANPDEVAEITLTTGTSAPLKCGIQGLYREEVKKLQPGQKITLRGFLLQWSPETTLFGKKIEAYISISGCELGH